MSYQFTVDSESFKPGEPISPDFLYSGLGCNGGNLSPHLHWEGAPTETKSFAVTLFDPDAAHGWWHWSVINIPNNVDALEEGASNNKTLPREAKELITDFKSKGYGGPCPPRGSGAHRYVFTVYALNHEHLEVDAYTTADMLKDRLEKTCLAKTSLTVKYQR